MLSLPWILPAVLAMISTAIPAAAVPIGGTALPGNQEFFVYQGSTQIGCVNGYGNFTANLQWCLPFYSSINTDSYATLDGYGQCSTSTGDLVCYQGTAAADTQFYEFNGNLAIGDTGTGTSFSVDSLPESTDIIGVPLIIGDGGSIDVVLQVKYVSG